MLLMISLKSESTRFELMSDEHSSRRKREGRIIYRGAVIGAIVSKLLDMMFGRLPETLLDLAVRGIIFLTLAYLVADMLPAFLDKTAGFFEAEPAPHVWKAIRRLVSHCL